ncbi:hypothetical protein PoB_007639500 [Plakobranchus ocellatus]|uniref:Uncharacterized protein n=1 Tax=Plakobranchus ocellatus TaxID=259542 RepID=A0AAV4E0M3_9GAST|nr:hypothetical protein PoB_007639500 [Plakobranchus ocellatus]
MLNLRLFERLGFSPVGTCLELPQTKIMVDTLTLSNDNDPRLSFRSKETEEVSHCTDQSNLGPGTCLCQVPKPPAQPGLTRANSRLSSSTGQAMGREKLLAKPYRREEKPVCLKCARPSDG